ncbi:hypothetical protein [Dongshaea marina]|uniref:hypothetical protein n=1 Tax=Dongshaea marina TaxID=2047966 RepID=UPI000D3EB7BD|nr:hypothetical protein [Dongshaea marina]
MDKKSKFVTKNAARIFSAMFANSQKDPSAKNAILEAEDLWLELVKKGYLEESEGEAGNE